MMQFNLFNKEFKFKFYKFNWLIVQNQEFQQLIYITQNFLPLLFQILYSIIRGYLEHYSIIDSMNKKPEFINSKNALKIINQYYQRFYHDRKKLINIGSFKSQVLQISPDKNQTIVFDINYRTFIQEQKAQQKLDKLSSKNTGKDKSQKKLFHGNLTQQNLFREDQSIQMPQKNVIMQIQNVTFPVCLINASNKISVKKKNSKVTGFDHFPEQIDAIKNQSKSVPQKCQFFNIHQYSKTVDFQNISSSYNSVELKSNYKNQPQKQSKLFSVQNFSHIKFHKNKNRCKQPTPPSNKKQMIDIVQRRKYTPTAQPMSSSVFMQCQDRRQINIKQVPYKKYSANKQGLLKQFKPRIQLKRRPSTGIPLKKSRTNAGTNSRKHQKFKTNAGQQAGSQKARQKLQSSSNKSQNPDQVTCNSFSKSHQRMHNRALSSKLQSPRTLHIKARQIKVGKYIQQPQTDNQPHSHQTQRPTETPSIRDIVHPQFHKHNNINQDLINKAPRHKGRLKNKQSFTQTRKLDQFLPWESTQMLQQFIQNDGFIQQQVILQNKKSQHEHR